VKDQVELVGCLNSLDELLLVKDQVEKIELLIVEDQVEKFGCVNTVVINLNYCYSNNKSIYLMYKLKI
jgi:hypothetical protein